MSELHFAPEYEAITLFRRESFLIKQMKSQERAKMNKALNVARHNLVLSFAESTLLRATIPENAFTESLVWFWFNHFNVFWQKSLAGVALPDYIDSLIRPNVRGSFRDLLLGTITHPAMLGYLDNVNNNVGHINENYARELLELHTLGVNGGYVQDDVKEVARVLTGFGFKPMKKLNIPPRLVKMVREQGEFLFNPIRHDMKEKCVLGHKIKGVGFEEIETLVDILVSHPSTANYISKKLCLFLLGDEPPTNIVDKATKVFSESKGDLAKTIDTIQQEKKAFNNNKVHTFKDPYRYVMSAVHLLCSDIPLKNAKPLVRWLTVLGQPLFGKHTPDGYSLYGRDWVSAGQLTQRFELSREMVNVIPRILTKTQSAEEVFAKPHTKTLISSFGKISRTAISKAGQADEQLSLLLSSPEFMYW